VKAGSLIMFCTRHTWFVDYRAQKCFVLLPSLTQAECKSPEPVAEAAYLTGELYGNLSGNRRICSWPAFAQWNKEIPELGQEQIYPVISTQSQSCVSCPNQHASIALLKSQHAHAERISRNWQRPPLSSSKKTTTKKTNKLSVHDTSDF